MRKVRILRSERSSRRAHRSLRELIFEEFDVGYGMSERAVAPFVGLAPTVSVHAEMRHAGRLYSNVFRL